MYVKNCNRKNVVIKQLVDLLKIPNYSYKSIKQLVDLWNALNCSYKNVNQPIDLLKLLQKKHPNAQKRSQLIDELTREFSSFSEFPEKAVIKVNNHYSRKLIKNVLFELGYKADGWVHHFTSPTRIFKIKE